MSGKKLDEQLAEAKSRLSELLEKFERYDGNNPNKYQSEIKQARSDLARVQRAIKEAA